MKNFDYPDPQMEEACAEVIRRYKRSGNQREAIESVFLDYGWVEADGTLKPRGLELSNRIKTTIQCLIDIKKELQPPN